MTNNDISHVLSSIAEAKRALDLEPTYLERLGEYERRVQQLSDTVADRELRIHTLKQTETDLIQKLRSVEAERDDAGFRALEETDKVQGLLTVVHSIIGEALKVVSAVDGTERVILTKSAVDGLTAEIHEWKHQAAGAESLRMHQQEEFNAEIERLKTDIRFAQEQLQRPLSSTEDTATAHGIEGVSGSGETKSATPHSDRWDADTRTLVNAGHSATDPTTGPTPIEGQRDADPTPAPSVEHSSTKQHGDSGLTSSVSASPSGQSDGPFAETTQTAPSPLATSTTVEPTADAASNASPPERNRDRKTFYTGRKYFDVTYFVPLHKWLEDGGTQEDYYWRPEQSNLPQPNRASHQS